MKLLILLIVFSTLAFGTSVIPYSENQVIDKSDLIIRGVVEDKDTEVDAYMNRIFTSYKIKISDNVEFTRESNQRCIQHSHPQGRSP